jgi:hypothetical protein
VSAASGTCGGRNAHRAILAFALAVAAEAAAAASALDRAGTSS